MRPILDLDPAIEPATAVDALAVFRDQAFEAHQAGVPEQVRTDPALLERRDKDALGPTR
jgi:hypothetical protein